MRNIRIVVGIAIGTIGLSFLGCFSPIADDGLNVTQEVDDEIIEVFPADTTNENDENEQEIQTIADEITDTEKTLQEEKKVKVITISEKMGTTVLGKTKQEFNMEGQLVKEIRDVGAYIEKNYHYDEQGKLISWTIDNRAELEGIMTCTYQYNEDGTLDSYWSSENMLGGIYSEKYTYENGILVSSYFWNYAYVSNKEYDSDLLIFEECTDGSPEYCKDTDTYIESHYIQYTYDDNGKEIESNYITPAGGHVIPRTSTTYKYNADGSLKKETIVHYVDPYYQSDYTDDNPYQISYVEIKEYTYEYY